MLKRLDLKHLGEQLDTGSIKLTDKGRDYQRIRQSAQDVLFLETIGFTEVMSSNVSAISTDGNDLLIRFHNESIYRYRNKANLYEPMLRSNSKGKYVWKELRYKSVPYRLEGKLTTPSGSRTDITYEDIDKHYREEYKRINLPIQESTEKLLKTLTNLQTTEVTTNTLNIVDILTLLDK